MGCTCPRDPDVPGICAECANEVSAGLAVAGLGLTYEPDRIMESMETQAEVAWDLGVSLPDGHPFAPVVEGQSAA